MKTDYCKMAIVDFFNCETAEDVNAYPKVRITAEVTLCERGKIHHFNTDEVKYRLEKAVAEAAWLCKDDDDKPKKEGPDGDTPRF